jgi:hypothetical protein
MRRQIAAVSLCAILFPAVLGVVASSSLAIAPAGGEENGANARPPAANDRQIYSSIKDIMDSVVDPSADVLWGAVGTVVDQSGVDDKLPKTPDEWHDVRRAAVRIIEGGNLLMMPGREAAPAGTKSEAPGVELEPAQIGELIKKKRKAFNAFAKALQAIGLEALRASEAKNGDLLIEVGGRMEDVCERCHQTFWYPQATQASVRKR